MAASTHYALRTTHYALRTTHYALMNKQTLLSLPIFLFLAFGCARAQDAEQVADPATPADISWVGMTDALATSGASDKKILVDFYTDWCGWCKRMDRDTYADPAVMAYLDEHFLTVKFNPEKAGTVTYDGTEYSNGDFAAAFSVRGYPATGFFNENNEVITLLPGYMKAADFLNVLRFIAEDHYLEKTFEEFLAGSDVEGATGEG